MGFKLPVGIFFIKFSLLPGLFNKNIIFKKLSETFSGKKFGRTLRGFYLHLYIKEIMFGFLKIAYAGPADSHVHLPSFL